MGGFSTSRLGRVRGVLAGAVQRAEVAEVVALLSRNGETHVETAGGAGPDTIFRIASMSKPVAAVAALILVEECVLRLDDPVDEYLPELASRRVLTRLDAPLDDTVPAERSITVRDLLTFQLGALPLVYQPGSRWLYNTGSDVLGVLIARVTGQPFGDFLQERIFAPLGMADTGFWVPPDSVGRLPPQYTRDPGTGEAVVHDPPGGQWTAPPAFPSGAGGLVSTAADYAAFASMLLGGGSYRGLRILSRPTATLMTSDQLPAAVKAVSGLAPGDFDDMGWGFGVSVVTRRSQPYHGVGTYGWNGGLGTSWVNDPAENLTLILLTQQAFTSHLAPALHRDFWTTAYQALED